MSGRMTTATDSAHLILKLFEIRREPVLREARAWFIREFNPATLEELGALASGPKNAWIRMVLGYWDMAASLVTGGAIDRDLFLASNQEMLTTFAKVEPFLDALRHDTPGFIAHMEAVLRPIPQSAERMAALREYFRTHAPKPESAPDTSVRVVARLTAKLEHVEEVREVLGALVAPTRLERGCVSYELLHNSADPTDFTFVETWTDQASLDAHGASAHLLDASAKLPRLLSGPADIRRYAVAG
jgi:quinol monooxygenase YgiN